MNSLPANELLRVVKSMQEDLRREAGLDRLARPGSSPVAPGPIPRQAPSGGRPEGVPVPEWRPLHRAAGTPNVGASHMRVG